MKLYYKIIFSILLFLNSKPITSQVEYENILNEDYYGFEVSSGDDGWWMQQPDIFSIETAKGANGSNRSLKYTNSTALSGTIKAFGSNSISQMLISLEAGVYPMKLMIWIDSGTQISKIKTDFREGTSVKGNVVFDLSGVQKDQWVEVSGTLNLSNAITDANLRVLVESSYVGIGTFYLDDIQLLTEKTVEIPLVSQISTSGDANLDLGAGEYEITLNVWLDNAATITKFYTSIVEPWVTCTWDLSSVNKGEWVELKQNFILPTSAVNSEFRVNVNNNPEYGGGKGVFYVDDIVFNQLSVIEEDEELSLSVVGETCPGKKNGKLKISAKKVDSYIIKFEDNEYAFNSNKTIENIDPGNYEVCVSVDGKGVEKCYSFKIPEAKTVAAKLSGKGNKTHITIQEGTAPFVVAVNGEEVLNTNSKEIEITSNSGDKIEVSTANDCEGKLIETLADFEIYPNPAKNFVTVLSMKGSRLEMLDMTGGVILKKDNIPAEYHLNISHLNSGIYFIRLQNEKNIQIEKLIIK